MHSGPFHASSQASSALQLFDNSRKLVDPERLAPTSREHQGAPIIVTPQTSEASKKSLEGNEENHSLTECKNLKSYRISPGQMLHIHGS